jgi:arginyl-tRNA synthetase
MKIVPTLDQMVHQAMIRAGIPEHFPARVVASSNPKFGDYQANGVLAAARETRKNPRELATEIVSHLDLSGAASLVEVAGPGFINIHLSNSFVADAVNDLLKLTLAKGGRTYPAPEHVQTIVVDYSSPNLAKEMHVGHLRSTIIGDAIARTLDYQGHQVIRQNHMGDWGTQFGMLIAELEEQIGEGERPELALNDLELFYQQAKAHFDSDAKFADKARGYVVKLQSGDSHCMALWQQFINISIAHSKTIYSRLNVTLDDKDIRPESFYNDLLADIVDRLKNQGLARKDRGAVVVFFADWVDEKKQPSPLIVQKSDGGFLYATSDLAALHYRSKHLGAHRVIYLIDARQNLHMKQVFEVARKAGLVDEHILMEHLPFGTMMGEDGKPFKTRAGGTIKLTRLLDEAIERALSLLDEKNPDLSREERLSAAQKIGIGAIKYADLCKTRTHDYTFDWDKMLSFEGNTAPYLQYAYTRISSIFRRAEQMYAEPPPQADEINNDNGDITITTDYEKKLGLMLLEFDETVSQVGIGGYPHILCNYVHDLASAFMSFYENCPILKDEVTLELRSGRLQICQLTAHTLQKGLELLGIETLERM